MRHAAFEQPALAAKLSLSPEQVAAYHEQGYLHVRDVIAPRELARLRRASEQLTAPASAGVLPCRDYSYGRDEADRPVLQRINMMQQKGAAFLHLWGHPRILAIAESLQGPEVLPVAMAMVMKTPGCGMAVPWHRDPANCTIAWGTNVGIYLDDADAENGMLHVIPGSHRRRLFDLNAAVQRHGFELPGMLAVPVRAGDVILHSENVLHGSREVRSQRQRRVIYFGTRSIPEQLSKRGLDAGWIRSFARILRHAQSERRAAALSAGEDREVPFTWRAAHPQGQADLAVDDYVELRIEGGDAHQHRAQTLPFEDDPPLV